MDLPNRRHRRAKTFAAIAAPLDRNAKVRIMARARALLRRTEPGKHYGAVSAKALAVLDALLWRFHNARSGLCFPGYERIAEAAGCARSTVALAVKALETAGLLSWENRIVRVRVRERDLFGHWALRWRVVRTSNTYRFFDTHSSQNRAPASKSDLRLGVANQVSFSLLNATRETPFDLSKPLDRALMQLGDSLRAKMHGVKVLC